MSKFTRVLSASVLLVLVLASCVFAAAGDKQLHITFVAPLVANPYWDVVEDGAKAAAAEFNVDLDYVGSTSLDMNQWMSYLEMAISNKSDGIVTMALNESTIRPIVDRAAEAGIPITLVDTDAPGTKRAAYAGTDNEAAGKVLAENLVEITGGKAVIGIMTGALDQPNLNLRMKGFNDGIAAHPDMKVVVTEADNSDLALCIQKAEAMIKAHPDITVLAGMEGFGVPGLSRVVQENNLVGKVTVVGFDDLADTLQYIKTGVAKGTVVQRQYQMGYLGVKLICDIKDGKTVDSINDTGVVFLDKDSVESYDPRSGR
ncbi:MAG: sugar-binding protein [Synergistaceae bacterium]|jgi:ribose transport system substrate-binding protein|nr:sugar-binding protein [Synergistaceae bacterium]